jgi:hypothetical protein
MRIDHLMTSGPIRKLLVAVESTPEEPDSLAVQLADKPGRGPTPL